MPPVRPAPLKLRRDASGRVRAVVAPDRTPAIVRAGTLLSQLTQLAGAPDARPVDVQIVLQVSDARGYAAWRAGREATWRAEGSYGTGTWPGALEPEELATVLLPLPFGVPTGTGAKTPPVVADPLFTRGSTADGAGAEDVVLGLLVEWLRQAVSGPPVRLAAPILEMGAERRVLDFGLTWPLGSAG